MPQPKKGARLGSNPKHQHLMLSNLARSLFEHERIQTTEAKAKLLRPYAERLITKAKKGTIHHRRQVLSEIEDRATVHKLFADIGPRFADRNGGYLRILKLDQRLGDAAKMAMIELVDGRPEARTDDVESDEAQSRRRRLGRRRRSGLPQDKPVRSKGEEAAAAGTIPGEPAVEDEDEDIQLEPEATAEAEEAEAPDDEAAEANQPETDDKDQ